MPEQDESRSLNEGSAQTLVIGSSGSTSRRVDVSDRDLEDAGTDRYTAVSLLGRGGMGEVHLCEDGRIGRHVARKLILPERKDRASARRRFLREARVQAQLEHPAIVPVYDIGRDRDGNDYFTMKRVRGRTLDEILSALRKDDPDAAHDYGRRRRLTAFSQVCLAIDFAHRRGVVHRDLKPGNVMLGDYGEVYILDWGLAKVDGAPELDAQFDDADFDHTQGHRATVDGEILGSPGYLAPEQAMGKSSAASDIYSLGSILFELLTLTRLHEGETAHFLLVSTLRGVEARPSKRMPELDIPPELEAICVRATAQEPEDRFTSARELHEAIERFLDGARDLALRARMADEHATRAQEWGRRALVEADEQARREALHEVGRALGFDPSHQGALSVLSRLLATPPATLPEEARLALEREHEVGQYHAAWVNGVGYLSWFLYLPVLLFMGIRDTTMVAVTTVAFLSASIVSFISMFVSSERFWRLHFGVVVAGTFGLVSVYNAMGLLFVPALLVAKVASFAQTPSRRFRWAVAALAIGMLAMVTALDVWGWIPPTTEFRDGSIIIHAGMQHLPASRAPWVFVLFSGGVIASSAVFVGQARENLNRAQSQIQLQAWQLRQLAGRHSNGLGHSGPS